MVNGEKKKSVEEELKALQKRVLNTSKDLLTWLEEVRWWKEKKE